MHAYSLVTALVLGLALVLVSGCEEKRDPLFSAPNSQQADLEAEAIAKDVRALAGVRVYEELKNTKGQELKADEAIANYHDAINRLIRRGASIETKLIESLQSNTDWGVRLGIIDVMQATATKRSVSALINVLDDEQPLVAMNADLTLREMTKHQVIPETGQPPLDGLPAPQKPDTNNLEPGATLVLWSEWHRNNKVTLKQHWTEWWEKNKGTVKID